MDTSAGFDTSTSYKSWLAWVDSYLTGRTQAVQVQSGYSEFWEVINGVPQGGPSPPGFFGAYIVDILMAMRGSGQTEVAASY